MTPKQPSLLTQELTTDRLLARNRDYIHSHISAPTREEAIAAAGGSRLPVPIIVSCFDARIIPDHFFDLAPGEATVLRNIGGRVNDHMLLQIAALGVLRPLGEILIVHREGCGATLLKEEPLLKALKERYGDDRRIDDMPFGLISDMEESVREDVEKMRRSPFTDKARVVRGFVYRLKTGLVEEVEC